MRPAAASETAATSAAMAAAAAASEGAVFAACCLAGVIAAPPSPPPPVLRRRRLLCYVCSANRCCYSYYCCMAYIHIIYVCAVVNARPVKRCLFFRDGDELNQNVISFFLYCVLNGYVRGLCRRLFIRHHFLFVCFARHILSVFSDGNEHGVSPCPHMPGYRWRAATVLSFFTSFFILSVSCWFLWLYFYIFGLAKTHHQ